MGTLSAFEHMSGFLLPSVFQRLSFLLTQDEAIRTACCQVLQDHTIT